MADDGGVLGNLPRSRPGQRSDKRTGKTAAKAAGRAERSGAKAAEPAAGAKPAASARPKPRKPPAPETSPRSSSPTAPRDGGGDPVGGAIRTVAGVAGLGAKVAGGVAREVLRRLPRP
jgi:hypothetical protein